MGRNTVAIWIKAPLEYWLITVKVVALEKVSFRDTQNSKAEKHYLINRDNLTQPIHIQWYQKQKTFSRVFFVFLKSILNFKHLPTKMSLIAYVFPEIPAHKNIVRHMSKKLCFRGPVERQHGKWIETL